MILSWYSQGTTCKLKPSVRLGVVHKFFDWPDIQMTSRLLHYHLIMASHFVSVIARGVNWEITDPAKTYNNLQVHVSAQFVIPVTHILLY